MESISQPRSKRVTIAQRLQEALQFPPGAANYRCLRCKLFRSCSGGEAFQDSRLVTGELNPDEQGRVAFVTGIPVRAEDQSVRFLQRQVLSPLGLTKYTTAWLTVARCLPANGRLTKPQVLLCREYLYKDLERIKPAKIVAMGGMAAAAILEKPDKEISLQNHISVVHETRWAPAIVTYATSAVLNSSGFYYTVRNHITKFLEGSMVQQQFPPTEEL